MQPVRTSSLLIFTCLVGGILSNECLAMSLDGNGHFGLRGRMETSPLGGSGIDKAQGVQESLFLEGELRFNDKSSFFLDVDLFDRYQYLGDEFRGRYCSSGSSANPNDCYPNVREPAYKPYSLSAEQAFVRYAFDYFIFEGGRRGRSWGMGLLLDEGRDPFSKTASVFDGVTFSINRQKSQTLGFALGLDKISEHGAVIGSGVSSENTIYNNADDHEQAFIVFEYDDSLSSGPSSLSKKVGIYSSRFFPSTPVSGGGSDTNLGLLDFYLNLQYAGVSLKNEMLATYGSSADPNGMYLGGARYANGDPTARNDYSSLAGAISLEWTIARSGGIVGPKTFGQGDLIRHVLYTLCAYAPGDSDGYYSYRDDQKQNTDATAIRHLSIFKRSAHARAVAFNPNFVPTLILFNEGNELSSLAVDGIYDPNRMMNAQLYTLGYKYENLQIGDFGLQLGYASLLAGIPDDAKTYYDLAAVRQNIEKSNGRVPVGYHGKSLGFEVDLTYKLRVTQDVVWGVGVGTLFPGKALQTRYSGGLNNNYLIETDLVFHF